MAGSANSPNKEKWIFLPDWAAAQGRGCRECLFMLTAWKTIGFFFKRYPEITPQEQESWKTIGVATGIGAKVMENDRCAI